MSQVTDYTVDNSTGANVRADINAIFGAIATNNSGGSDNNSVQALGFFANTSTSKLQLKNAAGNAFINLRGFDGTLPLPDGTNSAPSLFFDDDPNTGLFSSAPDTLNFTTGGVERMELGTTTIFNEDGADVDFRIEGVNEANLFYVDAGNRRIGIITSSPSDELHIKESKNGDVAAQIENTNTGSSARARLQLSSDSASLQLYATAAAYSGVSSWSDAGVITTGSGASGGLILNTTASGGTIKFQIQQSEKVRIDNDGRVLIGTTTEGHDNADDLTIATSGQTGITIRSASNQGGNIYFSDATSGDAEFDGFISYSQNVNEMFFGTNQNTRMTIDSSGDVDILGGQLRIDGSVGDTIIKSSGAEIEFTRAASSNITCSNASGSLKIKTGGNDSMLINSSGTLFIGKSSQSSSTAGVELYQDGPNFMTRTAVNVLGLNVQGNSTGDSMRFYFQDVHRGSLNYNGSTFAATTASDYRLKENDTPITDGIERIKRLRPIKFNWKKDSSTTHDGFIAHELQAVMPDCVFGEKDAEISEKGEGYQHISKEGLIPLLTAALKEEIAKREALEARIAALESS